MEVRHFVPSDAAELAELFNRNQYGPAEYGGLLTGDALLAMIEERCIDRLYVGATGTAVHGCLVFGKGSGRRSCPPDQRFAGMYVIDDKYRNSLLGGRLFRDAFQDVVSTTDWRTLRTLVKPTNARAVAVYLRAGFRSLPGARTDEYGFMEVISHLPGLVLDLRTRNPELEVGDLVPKMDLRMVRGSREPRMDQGVGYRDGRPVVEYRIDTGEMTLNAWLDMSTGILVDIDGDRVGEWRMPTTSAVPVPAPDQVLARRQLAQGLSLVAHGNGTLRLIGDGRLIVIEHWPTILGVEPPTTRRCYSSAVSLVEGDDEWTLTSENGITRRVRFIGNGDRSGIEVSTSDSAGRTVIVTPWNSMRVAEHALLLGDEWVGGPVLLGFWPPAWPNFEAALTHPELDSARASSWCDSRFGLVMSWANTRPRFEGRFLPQLFSENGSVPLEYRLEVVAPGAALCSKPVDGLALVPRPSIAIRSEPAQEPDPAPLWQTKAMGDIRRLSYGSHRLVVAPAVGLVEWSHDEQVILSGPYPSGLSQGSLVRRRVGLWCSTITPRWDEDQGVEWVEDSDAWGFAETPDQVGTWSVRPLSGEALRINCVPTGDASRDIAVTMVLKVSAQSPIWLRVNQRVWQVESGLNDWRGGVDAIAVELSDGRLLVVEAASAFDAPEIFARMVKSTVFLHLLAANTSGQLSWDLTLVADRAAAAQLLHQRTA